MKNVFLLVLFFLGNFTFAQFPPIEWAKCYGGSSGESSYSVKQTLDSGYVVLGSASSIDGAVVGQKGMGDMWLTKLDKNGNLQWQKCYGGTFEDIGITIIQLSDGGFLLTGYTKSNNLDISGNHGAWDGLLIRTDSNGNILWQKCYGGTLDDYLTSVVNSKDGGYLLYGYTFSNNGDVNGNHGSNDVWIVKINSIGSIIWQKCFGGSNAEGVGQSTPIINYNYGYVFVATSTSTNGDLTSNKGSTDVWVVNIDTIGNIKWQKNYGGSASDAGRSISFDKDSNLIVLSNSYSNDFDLSANYGQQDAWLFKINKLGNLIWQKNFGGTLYDGSYELISAENKGFFFLGISDSNNFDVTGNHGMRDVWIVKLDSNLTKEWHHCYGSTGIEQAFSIRRTLDNGIVFCGYATTNNGDVNGCNLVGASDSWIVKLVGSVGIYEYSSQPKIYCFPNPTSNYLSIKLENSDTRNYEIFDVSGRIISKGLLTNETISVENFHSGIYLINIETESGRYFAKFIKE